MDETKDDKKLLRSPLDTPAILSAQLEQQLLTTEDFIKTTPTHEMKNLFGTTNKEIPKPTGFEPLTAPKPAGAISNLEKFRDELVRLSKNKKEPEQIKITVPSVPTAAPAPEIEIPEPPKTFSAVIPTFSKKEPDYTTPSVVTTPKVKAGMTMAKFFTGLLFVILTLLIGLYIWGGILEKRQATTSSAETIAP